MHTDEYQVILKQDDDSTAAIIKRLKKVGTAFVDIHNSVLKQEKAEIRKCYNDGTSILELCQSIRMTISVEYLGFIHFQIKNEANKQTKLSKFSKQKNTPPPILKADSQEQEGIELQTPLLIDNPKGGIYEPGREIILEGRFQNATSYQWYKDGTELKGCKEETLVISNATRDDTGRYVLSAFNYNGSADSDIRIIAVIPKHVP